MKRQQNMIMIASGNESSFLILYLTVLIVLLADELFLHHQLFDRFGKTFQCELKHRE